MGIRYNPGAEAEPCVALVCDYCHDPLDGWSDIVLLSTDGSTALAHMGPCHDRLEAQLRARGAGAGWLHLSDAFRQLFAPLNSDAIAAAVTRTSGRDARYEHLLGAENPRAVLDARLAQRTRDKNAARFAAPEPAPVNPNDPPF
jgi:hypothetical protein